MILIQGKKTFFHKSIWQGEEGRKEKTKLSACQLLTGASNLTNSEVSQNTLFIISRNKRIEEWAAKNLERQLKVICISRYAQPHTKGKTVLHILISCLSCHIFFSVLDKYKWCSNKHTELLHRSFPALPLWPQQFSLCSLYCPCFYHITYLQPASTFKPTMLCLS